MKLIQRPADAWKIDEILMEGATVTQKVDGYG